MKNELVKHDKTDLNCFLKLGTIITIGNLYLQSRRCEFVVSTTSSTLLWSMNFAPNVWRRNVANVHHELTNRLKMLGCRNAREIIKYCCTGL